MSDELPTLWPADAHTLTKHRILKNYFDAWAPILSHAKGIQSSELLFVDGFAGPGQYSTGEPGSPIIAINAILDHSLSMPRPVRFRLIEHRQDRFDILRGHVDTLRPRIEASNKVVVDPPTHGDCETEIRRLISERAATGTPLGPALLFLDQFGYANVPMGLIQAVMAHPQCEVLSYLNCKRMNAYLSDETKWPTITAAYGDDSWRPAIDMLGAERQRHLIETYKARIRSAAKVEHVWSFAMFGKSNELIYWLIFSTKSLKGLEQMKKAMWKADDSGSFRFSDREAADPQGVLFFEDMRSDEYHADVLFKTLTGRVMAEAELERFVLTRTPFFKFKKAVQLLCKQGRAAKIQGQGWRVRFC
ncbi:MAG: three-Cys-motif partner protein TcmP [Acidobacteriota bacterium]